MAYTVKKAPHIEDEVTIQDEHGRPDLTLYVNLYVDDIMADIDAVRAKLGSAQRRIQELRKESAGADQVTEAYGLLQEAATELFKLIFGEGQTDELLTYYEGRTAAALGDLLPYITGVILPEVKKAQKELAARYTAWDR